MATLSQTSEQRIPFLRTRRGRKVIENLTAYAFIAPAGFLLFLFGVFPVIFAFFVSLHRWRRFPEQYEGLANYERALGEFAHVPFFWLGIGALGFAGLLIYRVMRERHLRAGISIVPGALLATSLASFSLYFFTLLPGILNIPVVLRQQGVDMNRDTFLGAFADAVRAPLVVEYGNVMLLIVAVSLIAAVVYLRWAGRSEAVGWLVRMFGASTFIILGGLALVLVGDAIGAAAAAAAETGRELAMWVQIVLISAGVGLVGVAYFLWTRAMRQEENRSFVMVAICAGLVAVAGVLLIMELPRVLGTADRNFLHSFVVTAMYSGIAVPFELAIGLGLAYLLFQKIQGRTAFRMMYFLPYITPFIATSIVFTVLFSHRDTSPINNIVNFFGIEDQKWLLEPVGIFRLMFGAHLPDWAAGPSLALIVIIIYTIWTYAGYHTVVFLAGLGNISGELYEAARIDGANGWAIFRRITLPLLSPTTFFLLLVSVIGTFQAFTQIWIMRTPAVRGAVDTVSVFIFEQARSTNPNLGYGSAMATVLFLVILILTLAQNRMARKRVFYG